MSKIIVSRVVAAAMLAIATVAMFAPAAQAAQCNTIFLTDKNGNISFPFCPPNRASGGPGLLDNTSIGSQVPAPAVFSSVVNNDTTPIQQGTPFNTNTAATLTAAQLAGGIITSTPAAAIALTLPLATAMDTANTNTATSNSFDFFVIDISNTAANTITMTTNTGWTLVGDMIITPLPTTGGTSAHFRATRTGAGAWTLYRLS
jgi:hypothetical protein